MRRVRQKKILGAIIGAVGSVASSLIQSHNQAKLQREQNEAQQLAQNQQNLNMRIGNLNQIANNDLGWAYDRFNPTQYRCGGKKRMKAELGKYKSRFGK